MTPFQVITEPSALQEVAAQLAAEPEVGLDTEFMREKTYYAKLCLIQIASPRAVFCVDPLAFEDLAPFLDALARSTTRKILHAARQDVEVLLTRSHTLPLTLFDTQVAAALCGMPPQIGYGELVARMLDVHLEKAHTRTDWAQRPLKEEQLRYAAEDAHYLLPLRAAMQAQLEKLGRLSWFEYEMQRLADPGLYRMDPQHAWQRLKGWEALDERRQRVMRDLAAWRETRAIQRDRPRAWILADDALWQLVNRLPATDEELHKLDALPRGLLEKCGAELLQLLDATAHLPSRPDAARHQHRSSPQEQARIKTLSDTLKKIAAQLQLSPEVLATRRDLQQLTNGKTDIEPLKGWRRGVIGEALLNQL